MEYLYSIIIPAWNVEKYIQKCINSCLQIKNIAVEVIVINDGSTDKTLEIVKSISYHCPNIRVISTPNRGLSEARNLGMKYAMGDYVIFLDADDWFSTEVNDFLSKIDNIKGTDVLFYRVQNTDSVTMLPRTQVKYPFEELKQYTGTEVLKIAKKTFVPHEAWRGIYNREFLIKNDILFLPRVIYEDVPFWFKIMANAKVIKYSNTIVYNCLSRDGSITHSKIKLQNIISVFLLAEEIFSYEGCTNEYLAVAARKIVDTLLFCERQVKTNEFEILRKWEKDIIEKKNKIIQLITQKYTSNENQIRMKYLLISNFTTFLGIFNNEMIESVLQLRMEVIHFLKLKMNRWPLKDINETIGIYGSGTNSDIILDTYRKIFGEIDSKYCYVDSYAKAEQNKKHYNHIVINVSELPQYEVEKVIVCSSLYEKEMVNTLRGYIPNEQIYSLYESNDFSVEGIISSNYIEIFNELRNTQKQKRIILLQTPHYPNLGDQLIAEAEKDFLQNDFKEYKVIEISNDEYCQYKTRIKREIKDDDILMVTGGGYFGSLWTEGGYDNVVDIISGYPQNWVWIMPMSIYFEDNDKGRRYFEYTTRIFAREKLKICTREIYSYEICRKICDNVLLCPDIALYYQSSIEKKSDNECGIFFRDDIETQLSDKQKCYIKDFLIQGKFRYRDSSMIYDTQVINGERKAVLDEKMQEIKNYKIVLTDRLHCMIMCALTGTKCIAFNNTNNKIQGVYQWIKELEYIKFVQSEKEFETAFAELINNKSGLCNSELKIGFDWRTVIDFLKKGIE